MRPIIPCLLARAILPVHSAREAGEQHNECREEQDDHRHENSPHASAEGGVAAASIAVDVALDDAEEDEVCYHHYECDEPRDGRNHRGEDCSAHARAEREEERDKSESARNGVKHHDARESL